MLSQTKELHQKLVMEFERLLESVGQEEDDDESDESAGWENLLIFLS